MTTTPIPRYGQPVHQSGRKRIPVPVQVALAFAAVAVAVMVTAGGAKAAITVRHPEPLSGAGLACTTAARVCMSESARTAWLLQDGVVVDTVPALAGRPGAEVPLGVFAVTFHDRHHVSTIYHSPMPYSVFFHGGSAFHEGSLSVPSHGCVHLSHSAAVEFYNALHHGDRVEIVP